jgi:hypothetical protein
LVYMTSEFFPLLSASIRIYVHDVDGFSFLAIVMCQFGV